MTVVGWNGSYIEAIYPYVSISKQATDAVNYSVKLGGFLPKKKLYKAVGTHFCNYIRFYQRKSCLDFLFHHRHVYIPSICFVNSSESQQTFTNFCCCIHKYFSYAEERGNVKSYMKKVTCTSDIWYS